MNREIKFRAWDKKEKKMVSWETMEYWNPEDFVGVFLGGDTSYILQQFTGLHDKNGKEIYEGDIVKVETENGGITEVFWNAAGFEIFRSFDERTGRYEGIRFGYWVPEAMAKVEVIGDIYSNPELFK